MWTARFFNFPFGEWLIGLVGLIVGIYGVSEVISSIKGDKDDSLDLSSMSARHRRTVENISRLGVGARGLIITVVGIFLVRAAMTSNPSEAHGTRESMLELANAVPGKWALLSIGIGLLAYAVDQAVHARYRRIRPVL